MAASVAQLYDSRVPNRGNGSKEIEYMVDCAAIIMDSITHNIVRFSLETVNVNKSIDRGV